MNQEWLIFENHHQEKIPKEYQVLLDNLLGIKTRSDSAISFHLSETNQDLCNKPTKENEMKTSPPTYHISLSLLMRSYCG